MQTQTQTPIAQIGEHVGIELGTKLVKDYFDAYPEQAYGHVIGRTIMDKILAQPGCEGIIVYPALDESGKRTLVYAGIDAKGKAIVKIPIVNTDGVIRFEDAIVADRSIPTGDDDGGGGEGVEDTSITTAW
ncbi:hypothetical protein SAMN05518672_11631 [Chitinophaga sp. CF118]|uniref:hypothetical protein n=1 Tax=Chitinophaga sp. CF118 TaxID=1884367 RepID=UPI0008E738C3|nr:hypothetical protein [Chitinophaga sp. CF118]SFF09782.1 hypothetical protein SAMN05518672_11631 [Chitinophaga sp. CF118]